jgi:hypothetical protein
MSGDATINSSGVVALGTGVIVDADVNASAAISASKVQYIDTVTSDVQAQIDAVTAGTLQTIDDDNLTIQDNVDQTKQFQFQASGITTGTTRIYTMPDADTSLTGAPAASSTTVAGIVELATDAETATGTDTARATTPANIASLIGSVVQAYDADTLKADTADVLTAGFAVTIHDAGTKSSGTYTPDEADGNMQKFVNGGAHTLAPPANNCTLVLQQTNNASAGTITTSGFTLVDGDDFTTTNGHDFFLYITNSDSFSLLTVKALQ